ncbi:TetR/AcrR family transcriptional regulator [bacterium]|nr:TetR/AcrR family transcriptional regulator [bacterium]
MSKGETTRAAILDQALDLASEVGLEGLTIGVLAARVGMSKSGLYAHFSAKENLQCEVLDAAAERFARVVVARAFAEPPGLPQLTIMFDRWLHWNTTEFPGGCLFSAAAGEFDDRPGAVRDRIARHVDALLTVISSAARFAQDEGLFRDDLDPEQFAFEYWGLLQAHHLYVRLLGAEDADRRARTAHAGLIEGARDRQSPGGRIRGPGSRRNPRR